ncbi:hypothetical protein ACFQI7_21560 [Paenibacillus allorhizosphaerae]|uniref:Uncharacterized protein n=1 Tax=Paenibacillus allorhizosphaerae TaxID=2849866 RepID=A0ABM8VN57_9BACL|nr:hypothetical protein [Paenibacillus allorhizosphaerae]CAG7650998.1 hypothetical protein PAECIP111802_04859 [Paenibacillus allorhizosphaerae]
MKKRQAEQEKDDYIMLEKDYILRLREGSSGVEGDVIMLDAKKPGQGTHLFDAPAQDTPEALAAWARQALRAYREG